MHGMTLLVDGRAVKLHTTVLQTAANLPYSELSVMALLVEMMAAQLLNVVVDGIQYLQIRDKYCLKVILFYDRFAFLLYNKFYAK
jgi:hypothetical protein